MSENKKSKNTAPAATAETDETGATDAAMAQGATATAETAAVTGPAAPVTAGASATGGAAATQSVIHYDVDDLLTRRGVPAWQGAALRRAEGWAPGKLVTPDEFDAALARLRSRRMGG